METRPHRYHFFIIAICMLLVTIHTHCIFGDAFSTFPFSIQSQKTSSRWRYQPGALIWLQLQMTASVSGAAAGDGGDILSSTTATADKSNNKDDEKLDMPWSEVQEWALKDNISKFTIVISTKRYTMWRTLTKEIPELAGYPINFLREMYQRILKKEESEGVKKKLSETTTIPGVLPMVDNFEFASNGGITGRAYGLPGIADGTQIQTPPLISAETTIPLGYITSLGEEDSIGFSYELGTCTSLDASYSLDERSTALAAARRLVVDGSNMASAVVKDVATVSIGESGLLSDKEANQDLIYLGSATALVLTAATALGALSHHLTVNVFWV